MGESTDRQLLERATVALERQERAFERQGRAFERQEHALERTLRQMDERAAREAERDRRLFSRLERSERVIVEALGEINVTQGRMQRELAEMGEQVRANTQAVLSVLDRLEPRGG